VKKGTKGGDLRSKTKGGDKRTVPLSTELVSLLKEYKLSCKRSELTDYVWGSQTGHFISDSRFGEELRASIKRSNVNPINWHMFRHYYASMLFLRYSEDVSKITKWMGHADEAVTKKVYRHWLETEDQQAEDQSNIDTLYSLKAPIKMTGTDDGFYPE
jgi:integrase